MGTYNCYALETAVVSSETPNTPNPNPSTLETVTFHDNNSSVSRYKQLFIKFNYANVKQKQITQFSSISIVPTSKRNIATNGNVYLTGFYWAQPWNVATVTYGNTPLWNLRGQEKHYLNNIVENVSITDSVELSYAVHPEWFIYTANGGYYKMLVDTEDVTNYYSDAQLIFANSGENAPHLSLEATDIPITVSNPQPTSGSAIKAKDNTFYWGYTLDTSGGYVIENPTIQTAKFRWRPAGTTEYTEVTASGTMQHTVPANTFTSDNIEWQVLIQSTDGVWSAPSNWITLSTLDAISSTTPLYPVNAYIDGTIPNTFTWRHDISSGTSQTGFDLKYSADSQVNWTEYHEDTARQSYTIDTLPAGDIVWQVRTYNSDGVAGSWSPLSTVKVKNAPTTPAITYADTKPMPTIKWSTTGQQVYQVVTGDYDSGFIFGTEKEYQIPIYLGDGIHTVSVRVQNEYALWSQWGSIDINVNNVAGNPIALLPSANNNYGNKLEFITSDAYDNYLIYRDDKLIASTSEVESKDCSYEETKSGQSVTFTEQTNTAKFTALTINGTTTETGAGAKSPSNPYILAGTDKFTVTNGGSTSVDYALGTTLYGLPNGVRDILNALSGNVVKNINTKVYNGSSGEGWYYNEISKAVTVRFGIAISNITNASAISSHFAARVGGLADDECITNNTTDILLQINKSRLNGWSNSWTNAQKITAFNTWLAANPVTVLYQLATPATETVTALSPVAYAPTTVISVNSGSLTATLKNYDGYNAYGTYTDYCSLGSSNYKVRGVKGAYYTLSNAIDAVLSLNHSVISLYNNINWVSLKAKEGGNPERRYSNVGDVTYQYYNGRELPVACSNNQKSISASYAFNLIGNDNRADIKMLQAMVGKQVIYKDYKGDLIIGTMDNFDYSTGIFTSVTFKLTAVSV